jgi:uncharacterized membrane-anchored protein
MIQARKSLIAALVVPIVSLVGLAGYKKYILSFGEEIRLPVSGYDPRDLLSGHYLIYRIDYGVNDVCGEKPNSRDAFVCLEPRRFSYDAFENCRTLIRGTCMAGRFEAGIEKFFVPEEMARKLEEIIRTQPAEIILSVPKTGRAQVKDLLINGRSWSEY